MNPLRNCRKGGEVPEGRGKKVLQKISDMTPRAGRQGVQLTLEITWKKNLQTVVKREGGSTKSRRKGKRVWQKKRSSKLLKEVQLIAIKDDPGSYPRNEAIDQQAKEDGSLLGQKENRREKWEGPRA